MPLLLMPCRAEDGDGRDGEEGAGFAPLPPRMLDDLVPADHFDRHLERSLDLACVRDLVRDAYPETGRPERQVPRHLLVREVARGEVVGRHPDVPDRAVVAGRWLRGATS